MNSENGKIEGSITVNADFELNGMVTGSVVVEVGAFFRLNGMVLGDLILKAGSEAEVNGVLQGNAINEAGKLTVAGVVKGSLIGDANISPGAIIQ
ncbi:hypothetical protein CTTA_3716 [Comamonas testosteroni]|uniref:Polymer-forming cytoskeletal protein n=1 Tax=Comamonas testosteroni TaxID=285 RepID=A0A5A7MIJ2_COMTE|nr:hypothetical protein [Comamonas testosteroni]GEQ76711.1 hypothetical protein CTTA_3716 [Comamonas testosteroni]